MEIFNFTIEILTEVQITNLKLEHPNSDAFQDPVLHSGDEPELLPQVIHGILPANNTKTIVSPPANGVRIARSGCKTARNANSENRSYHVDHGN